MKLPRSHSKTADNAEAFGDKRFAFSENALEEWQEFQRKCRRKR